MSYRNIECLMINALEWVEQWDPMKGGSFNRTSADGGEVSLSVGDIQHDGLFYRALKIRQVTIPSQKRENGLYSFFVHRLEDTAYDFGAIWHETVDCRILIDRHIRYKLHRRGKSFFKITGSPHPRSLTCGMSWLHAIPMRTFQ
ncbi:hypothetical protein [Bowmanella dokdonensis]|uniref:Uncharacterized protein n=1 Tax=Bowmanella dokdonensis TaxID=751969 RepID=A0A939ISE3_9ALTE|nr:hypothetical protein [Bowmanella dokdonensis]MBN7826637.1 hypothetical protein [Bowmanella dokdonensis]